MPRPPSASLAVVLALLFATAPTWAESSASTALSNSASTSVGSSSNSIERSSDSSSGRKDVAAGDYEVIELADAPGRSGALRLTLRAVPGSGADGEFFLVVPREAAAQARIAEGQVIRARQRPYGLEFAQGPAHEAFFLVLSDDWFRELQTQVVTI